MLAKTPVELHALRRLDRLSRKVELAARKRTGEQVVELAERDRYGRYDDDDTSAGKKTAVSVGAVAAGLGGAAYVRGRFGNNYAYGVPKQTPGGVVETARRGAVFAGKDMKRVGGAMSDAARAGKAAASDVAGSATSSLKRARTKLGVLIMRAGRRFI